MSIYKYMSRNYCFTKFGEWGLDKVDLSRVGYLCYQEEICPKSLRRHYQGYVQCKSTCRVKSVQAILGIGKSHCEMQKGTNQEARAYCMKLESRVDPNGVPVEFGVFCEGQGERTDLMKVTNLPIRTVAIKYPDLFVRFHRGLIARADWVNNTPEAQSWECRYYDTLEEFQQLQTLYKDRGEEVYYVRTEKKQTEAGFVSVSSWDSYDYEKVAICTTDDGPEWTPFVKSIYRGLIVNKVRLIYKRRIFY